MLNHTFIFRNIIWITI